ncbi:zinc-ribbon domain-containing protein [Lederbergia citrisecunda]|uniref:zinc-ribbon domain-containing protein n=1 Tax=Lederbergia citrisecunda TaxID=2833583 RepID=UPI003D2857CC
MDIKREFNESKILMKNAMLRFRPELFYEWDFDKNYNLNVYKITFRSGRSVWWRCPNCESSYDMEVFNRTRGINCPYCAGKRINWTNSLASLRPDIAQEWHPTKNGELTPHDVPCSHSKKVWWLGECGHWWEAVIYSRTSKGKHGCPYCSRYSVRRGETDVWTTNPKLASMLANPEDGYKYMQNSNVRVDWKCLECKNIIKNKMINNVNSRGISCPKCSDGISFPEKFIYNLIKEANLQFEFDISREWSQGKRYDFFVRIGSLEVIIEVHGGQHYEERGFRSKGGRSLKKEQENDELKEKLARDNGVHRYIVIDARESTVEWMKNSILNSGILNIIDIAVDFEKIGKQSSNSLVKESCDLWNSGKRNVSEIAELMNLSRKTICDYLKKGATIGWCDYCPEKARRKPIVQLSKTEVVIKTWDSGAEIIKKLGTRHVSSVCKGKLNTTKGFKWMYKEDYDRMIQEGISHEEYMNKYYPQTK